MKKNKPRSFSAIIVLCFMLITPNVIGQVKTKHPSREATKLIKDFKKEDKYTDSGAIILLKDGQMTVGQKGITTIVVHLVAKIINKDAASDYRQIAIPFSSFYEKVNLDFAHTIGANGQIVSVSKDAIQVKTLPQEYDVKSYSNTFLLTFTLPALEEGSIFEYQVTKTVSPIIKNKWTEQYSFNNVFYNPSKYGIPRIDPVYKSKFVLKVPETDKFIYSIENLITEPVIKNDNGFFVYTWSTADLPSIVIEDSMPPLNEQLSKIRISSLKNWSELDKWAYELFSSKISLKDEIQAKASEITEGSETEEERIWKLACFMKDKIKYVYAHLDNSGYEPHLATNTLQNQYGDCKDHVILLISLLKAIGINAFPALINPRPNINEKKDIPSPDFSHVITYIPRLEGDLWIDTSSGFEDFPVIHWANHDLFTFILDGKGGKFLKTPVLKADDNQCVRKFSFQFKNGTPLNKMVIELNGTMSSYCKYALRSISKKEQEKFVREIKGNINPDEKIINIDISDLSNPTVPFKATILSEHKDILETILKDFTYAGDTSQIALFFSELYKLPDPETRKNDYIFGHRIKLAEEFICTPPSDKFCLDVLPKSESFDTDMVSFKKEFSRVGNAIKVQSEFSLKKTRIDKKDYEQFYKSIQDIIKKWNWNFVFKKQKIDKKAKLLKDKIEKLPQDPIALLELSKHYITKAKYKEAMELLKKAVEIAPENGEIHYYLGITLSYMDNYDDANKKFNKANELGYRP